MNAPQVSKKDLKLLVRDRRSVFVLIAMPLAFIAILGLSTGQLFSQREKARKVRLGIVNEDTSDFSGRMLTEVYKLKALQIEEIADRKQAKRRLVDGDIDVMVMIGEHYHDCVEKLDVVDVVYPDKGVLDGQLENLDVHVQAGAFLANAAQVIDQLVFSFALKTISPYVLEKSDSELANKLFLKAKREAVKREAAKKNQADGEADELPQAPAGGNWVYQILVPSYTVMFVFFIVTFMARSFIEERDLQTLKRLRIAPISRTGLLVGKTIPFLVVSLVQTVLLFLAGKLFFGMSWGVEPWFLPAVMVATSLAATALGLLVATLVRTDSQVSAYGTFLVLILAGLSGCLMPRSWQPELMQKMGLITP